ncbi:MAG: carboxypeptidase regulatory-like domain-containing protein [Terriglobia bacterium]
MSRQPFRLRVYLCLASLLVFLAGIRQPLNAQVGMATLSGIVTDPSGAVISNAEVALEGTSESVARQTVTNSTGTYVIPSILPGTYRLSVKANGFESHAVDNIILSSGQGSTINVILQVGEAKAVVTVTEKSPLLETTTATMGTTVTAQKITSLPLRGRNFSSLLTTLPGVAPFDYSRENLSPGATAINPPVNGQRPRDNEYTLDGVPNMEVIFNAVAMFPPPEAIAEMKVQSGMDSGAFGWSSGADIDVVTKSGTNQYHGDVWEYLQNGSLNARSYFSPSVGAYQWNQFGGAFGGPLVIPHLLSKRHGWYIFGYYEGLRDNSSGPFTSFVPTTAEMNGDFTGDPPIYNPYTTVTDSNGQSIRQQFPGNIIPSGSTTLCAPQPTCINSAAEIIYRGLIPTANFPSNIIPGVNYVGHSVSRNTYDNWSARVDHQFGAKDNFFGRYSDARNPQSSVSFPNLPSLTHARYTNIDAGDIHTFGPSTVLTARFGMQRTNYGSVTGGPNVAVQAGTLDAYPPFHGFQAIPPLTIPGFPSVSQGVQIYGPEYMYTLSGDVQKTFGRHTFGFGAAFYRGSFITDNQTSVSENFTTVPTSNFAGGTGDALASYLLGLPSSAGREIGSSEGNMLGYAGGLYAQDSWQINSKLHLNLGLRWDYAPPMINVVGSGTFSWETGQYYWDVKNPITGQPANIRRGLIPPDRRDFQPRIGIAYAVSPKTVGRASYAIYTGNLGMNWGQEDQNNRGNWPFGSPQSEGSLNATLPTAFLQNPFPPGPAVPSSTPQGALLGMEVVPSGSRSPMTQEWSASVQQQLTPSTKLELDYFGSHSIHLVSEMVDNTATTPGLGPFQARQRWPQFPPYTNGGYNMFPSFYDGGDVSLTNQHSRNLSLLINYTYSKVIDYVDEFEDVKLSNLVPTRFTIPSFRGPAQFSTTNRLVGSYVYDIPVHPKNRLLNAIAGGWEHSGIVGIDSGFPYYAFLTTDQANIGAVGGRPDQFPNLLFNPGANFHPTANEWFNTAAYQLPVFGTFGNAGKHALYGPGEVNWDASLAKKWPFGEGRDVGFKAEFFNLPNFSTFADPGSVFGTSQFGKVNGTRQGGRVIQFALKIHF